MSKIRIYQIETQEQVLTCDCGKEMVATGKTRPLIFDVILGKTPEYQHECSRCGAEEWEKAIYPRNVYKRIKL